MNRQMDRHADFQQSRPCQHFVAQENILLQCDVSTVLLYLFCSLAILDPRVGHTMDVLSPFILPCTLWSTSSIAFLMVWLQYASFLALTVSNSFIFTPALLRTHSFVFFAVDETRRIFLCHFISKASRRVSSLFLSVQLSQLTIIKKCLHVIWRCHKVARRWRRWRWCIYVCGWLDSVGCRKCRLKTTFAVTKCFMQWSLIITTGWHYCKWCSLLFGMPTLQFFCL